MDKINAINALISERTGYGRRTVVPTETSYYCFWSNGSAMWFVSNRELKKGMSVVLDANEIAVPKKLIGKKELIGLFETKAVKPLPLFSNSFEYMHQGNRY